MKSLEGKVAIVTGGGQGIGRCESLQLAEQGAAVIVNDMGGLVNGEPAATSFANQVVDEIRAAGGRAEANFSNVADWSAAEQMVQQAIDAFGRIDILVCNAGIVRDRMIHNMSEAEWDAVVNVHLKGHFAPTRHLVSHWREKYKASGGEPINGRIIYTTSEAGMYGNIGQPNYSAAKAGTLGLCFEAAKEVARMGCTVNVIGPRARTPMTEGTFGEFKQEDGFDAWAPENVSPWVAYLAGEQAAGISGQAFVVYGGTIRRMQAWGIEAEISQNKRWTVEDLHAEAKHLIPDLVAAPPELPDLGLPVGE